MTTLLEDIKAERIRATTAARSLAKLVLTEMCGAISTNQSTRPVVAALVGSQTELYYPTWVTDEGKQATFASISAGLQSRGASAAIYAFPATVSADEDSERERAVIIMTQTLDWREMLVHPFSITEDEVTWAEPYLVQDFKSPLLDISSAN